MIFLLEQLYNLMHNYGFVIIAFTLLIRIIMWPLSKAQMQSMKNMQILQPKMKQLQDRYKAEPQKLQAEMMKLYSEHKVNPFSGCLPLIIQLPVLIAMYGAISSPDFMAGKDPIFLDTIHLKRAGIFSHGGKSNDGKMNIGPQEDGGIPFLSPPKDSLVAMNVKSHQEGWDPNFGIRVHLKDGTVTGSKIKDTNNALTQVEKKLLPGVPVHLTTSFEKLDLDGYQNKVASVDVMVNNAATRESEMLTFTPDATLPGKLKASLPTELGKNEVHYDVMALMALFAASMLFMQKQMSKQNPAANDNPQQAQMMKMMSIMFLVLMLIYPIPAGVFLYMLVNSAFQVGQTWWMNRGDKPADSPSTAVVDVAPNNS